MSALEELSVRSAGQGREHAENDLAPAGARRRYVALVEMPDSCLDESAHLEKGPLRLTLGDEARELGEPPAAPRKRSGVRHRFLDPFREHLPRAINSPDRGKRELVRLGVGPRTLPERR